MATARALIFGASGQDGSYLAELLAGKGYTVYGASRRAAPHPAYTAILADVRDTTAVDDAVRKTRPDEIYNLAGTTSVPETWQDPLDSAESTALGPLRILEAVRRLAPGARFFQASSAQVFGQPSVSPQDESTPVRPLNPYGAAKAYADTMVRAYRKEFGIFACSAILYNHESPRRGRRFVTTQIAEGAARIKAGLDQTLEISDLSSERDWGFAGDYAEAMWLMLQQPHPDDFVIATGQARTISQLAEAAFSSVGLDWRRHVRQRAEGARPGEATRTVGNPAKARLSLGWQARTSFESMVQAMVAAATDRLKRGTE